MGLVDTIKRRYELRQVGKYTKRRMSQSQFESRDKEYYNSIYVDGAYLQESNDGNGGNNSNTSSSSSSSSDRSGNGRSLASISSVHRPERWSLPSFLRRNSHRQQSLATQQIKTSESYTMNG